METKTYSPAAFAKLCNVDEAKLTDLREEGLLLPQHEDTDGKPLYSHAQYQDYLLTACLMETGMDVEELRQYFAEEDPHARERIIRMRIAALDGRIRYLMDLRKVLASTFTSQGGVLGTKKGNSDEIRLVDREAEDFWALEDINAMDDAELVERIAGLVAVAQPFAICMESSDIEQGNIERQRHLIVAKADLSEAQAHELGLARFTRAGGRYGVTTQQPGETPADVYGRLLKSMSDFNEHPGEYFYEEYPSGDAFGQTSPLIIAVEFIPDEAPGALT